MLQWMSECTMPKRSDATDGSGVLTVAWQTSVDKSDLEEWKVEWNDFVVLCGVTLPRKGKGDAETLHETRCKGKNSSTKIAENMTVFSDWKYYVLFLKIEAGPFQLTGLSHSCARTDTTVAYLFLLQYFRTENITYYFLKLNQDLFNWQDCLILAPELIQLWPIFFCCTFFSLFIPLVRRPLEKIATPKICSIVHALPNTTKLRNKLAAFRLVVVILIARALNRFVMADAHEPPNIPNAEKKIRAINFWMREKEYTIVSSGNDWCLKNSLYVPFEKKKKIIPGLISFILYATQSMIANETTFSRAWKWSCPSEWRFIVTSDQLLYDGG